MKTRFLAAAVLAATTGMAAHAANITVSTGYSTAGAQGSAADYQSVVNAAVATPGAGYGSTSVAVYDNISNHGLFGGTTNDIAFKSVIDFGVTASNTGTWDFRFGVDFGNGGAVFLDGIAVATRSTDMWWSGNYSNPSQFFSFSSNLNAGNHTIAVFGLEHCCDGGQQAQYRVAGTQDFRTFDNATLAPVPEPETYAMLLAGLGMVGTIARRRKKLG